MREGVREGGRLRKGKGEGGRAYLDETVEDGGLAVMGFGLGQLEEGVEGDARRLGREGRREGGFKKRASGGDGCGRLFLETHPLSLPPSLPPALLT